MSSVLAWALGGATIFGGIAALFYFWDKWRDRNRLVEEDKEVTSAWWEGSDLKRAYEARGFQSFRWSNGDRVAERQNEGYEIIYLMDQEDKKRLTLVNRSGQVLIGQRGA